MHKQIIIGTKITISLTPIPLEVTIRNKLKHSRRYHSGKISNGVEKAFEQRFATLTTPIFGESIRVLTSRFRRNFDIFDNFSQIFYPQTHHLL